MEYKDTLKLFKTSAVTVIYNSLKYCGIKLFNVLQINGKFIFISLITLKNGTTNLYSDSLTEEMAFEFISLSIYTY